MSNENYLKIISDVFARHSLDDETVHNDVTDGERSAFIGDAEKRVHASNIMLEYRDRFESKKERQEKEQIDPFWTPCPAVDFIMKHYGNNKGNAHYDLFEWAIFYRHKFLRHVPGELMVQMRLFLWERDIVARPIWAIFKAALIQVPIIAAMDYFVWRLLF